MSYGLLKPTKAETGNIRRLALLSHAWKYRSNDCFGRAFLVTVKITGAFPHAWHARMERNHSRALCFECSRQASAGALAKRTGQRIRKPQFNYEPFNSSSVNIRFWSWNYRGCWHQTCPPIDTRFWMALNIPHCIPHTVNRLQALFLFAASSFFLTLGNLRACCPP